MNGFFEFNDKGSISALNLTFTDETEKNAWQAMLHVIGGSIPETKMAILTKPFSTGLSVVIKKSV